MLQASTYLWTSFEVLEVCAILSLSQGNIGDLERVGCIMVKTNVIDLSVRNIIVFLLIKGFAKKIYVLYNKDVFISNKI